MLKWGSFVKNKDGEWDGLNNAAIYTFNSNIINSLVREMFQNSIDARDKNLPEDSSGKKPPLVIRINYKEILQTEFPDFEGFYNVFKLIAKSNKDHHKFFNNAFAALNDKRKIPFFIYEDFNTTGLEGADDDPKKSFNACVVSEGVSVKSDSTAGGSFGIGKNAIYGLSKLRTVFYVSLNKNNEYIFQGKAKLASYYDENSKTRDNKIYCGIDDTLKSVRDIKLIPDLSKTVFHRDRPGLSQFAVCPVKDGNWTIEFAKAILRNYWMLLEKGELIVELLDQDEVRYKLEHDNLEQLLLEFYNPEQYEPENVLPKGNPYEFYKCYKVGKCVANDKFPHLHSVKFYYTELKNKDTNRIAYLRNDMVVNTESVHGFSSIGYCGVFLCNDRKGNEILRAMEPPTHDSFDPDRLFDKMEDYDAYDGRKILQSIKQHVKQALQEIMDQYTKPAEDIKWLDDLLASLTAGIGGSGTGERMNEPADRETTERIGKTTSKTLAFNSENRNTIVNNETGDIEGTGGGQSGGTGGGSGSGGGGGGNGKGGGPSGSRSSQKTKIKSRIFRTNSSKEINGKKYFAYKIILDCNTPVSGTDLMLTQHGDSGDVAFFEIGEARLDTGERLEFKAEQNKESEKVAYRLKSLKIPNVIEVFVHEPYKSSFKIAKS